MSLSVKQLTVFCSLARTESLGVTAEALCMTKGAVSQSLKKLESDMGVVLFDRVNLRLNLNANGRILLPQAESLIAQYQVIQNLFRDEKVFAPLRLGASRTIGNYILPELLAKELKQQVTPQIFLNNSSQLQMMVENYQLDLALIESNRLNTGLEWEKWRDDAMVVIAPPSHQLAGQTVDWAELSEQPWVLREGQSGSREQFDHFVQPYLDKTPVAMELNSLEAIMRAVRGGVGISLVSKLACCEMLERGELSEIRLPKPIVRQFSFVYQPGSQSLPQLRHVIDLLRFSNTCC